MSYTRQRLINRALRELGVLGAGQTANAEDAAAVDEEIEPVMSDLSSRGIWAWGDPDDIPDEAAVHLGVLIADSCAVQFGRSRLDERVRLLTEARLRQLEVTTLSGQRVSGEFY